MVIWDPQITLNLYLHYKGRNVTALRPQEELHWRIFQILVNCCVLVLLLRFWVEGQYHSFIIVWGLGLHSSSSWTSLWPSRAIDLCSGDMQSLVKRLPLRDISIKIVATMWIKMNSHYVRILSPSLHYPRPHRERHTPLWLLSLRRHSQHHHHNQAKDEPWTNIN